MVYAPRAALLVWIQAKDMEALMKKFHWFILVAAVLITAFEVFSLTA
jgi:hypothetical protein